MEKLQELKPIFYPQSIAVVGASTDMQKAGSQWLRGLLSAGFRGELYPVNPSGGEILGLKVYPNLRAIPSRLDLVIVCIPRTSVLELLDDCAVKGVSAVQFFTAGFRETGKPEWIEVEKEMVRRARQGGFRIIGPNCIGVYCPEHRISYGTSGLLGEAGSVGFVCQSGGHGEKIVRIGLTRDIRFSKVVSLGNSCDLGSADFLGYLAVDPKTSVVGIYIEGPQDHRRIFEAIRATSSSKPTVVWRGGRTQPGARAATSHTGALAASVSVWSAAMKQAGAIEVQSLEELADTLLLFQKVGHLGGRSVGIICGLADGGGGEAVLTADACALVGLDVPLFTDEATQQLRSLLGDVGSVICNPVDVNQIFGNGQVFQQIIELIVAEPHIDLIVVYENTDILSSFLSKETTEEMNGIVIDFRKKRSKPIVVVLPPGSAETGRLEIEDMLSRAGIPVYPTMERAAKAIRNVYQYFWRVNRTQ